MPIPKIPGSHAPPSKKAKIPEVEPAQAPELSDENDKSELEPLPTMNPLTPPEPVPIEKQPEKPAKTKAIPAQQVDKDGNVVDANGAKSAEAEQEEQDDLRERLLKKQPKARQDT